MKGINELCSELFLVIINERANSVMFVFNRDFRYVCIHIYIYVCVWPYVKLYAVRNVGGVKCRPLSKA